VFYVISEIIYIAHRKTGGWISPVDDGAADADALLLPNLSISVQDFPAKSIIKDHL
jgi:hypothetical protein